MTSMARGILLPASGCGAYKGSLKTDGTTKVIPVRWAQAFLKLISSPDKSRLEGGEILCEIKKRGNDTFLILHLRSGTSRHRKKRTYSLGGLKARTSTTRVSVSMET